MTDYNLQERLLAKIEDFFRPIFVIFTCRFNFKFFRSEFCILRVDRWKTSFFDKLWSLNVIVLERKRKNVLFLEFTFLTSGLALHIIQEKLC